jgi:hypothetical protein
MCCRVPKDLILFRSIECNDVCYLYFPLSLVIIWYGAQTILRLPKMGYCMFIEYFVLWTWVQRTLNVSKLNWSSILLWLSTWFTIPRWKTRSKQNLQYPYIGCVKYFNCPLIYLFEWRRPSSMQIPSFYSFFIIVNCRGSIGVATM